MEEVKTKALVNVLAFSDKDPDELGARHRVIRVQKSNCSLGEHKFAQVCLGIEKSDDDPEDVGVEQIYLFLEKRSELDLLIMALKSLREEIYSDRPYL